MFSELVHYPPTHSISHHVSNVLHHSLTHSLLHMVHNMHSVSSYCIQDPTWIWWAMSMSDIRYDHFTVFKEFQTQ